MSDEEKTILAFLREWLAWAEAGAPESEIFFRYNGLCNSFDYWSGSEEYDLSDWFVGVDNKTYPFGGVGGGTTANGITTPCILTRFVLRGCVRRLQNWRTKMDSYDFVIIAAMALVAVFLVGMGAIVFYDMATDKTIMVECIKAGKTLISGSCVELAK